MRAYYDAEMADRAVRPLGEERTSHLSEFVDLCKVKGYRAVVEVGCGAGRDAKVIVRAGLGYIGVDLSAAAVDICQEQGLEAIESSATELPFADGSFDAGWTMSTLMHLPGDDILLAVSELARVIRLGGVLEVGVWGADHSRVRVDRDGRYFRQRTDEELEQILSAAGQVTAFATWDRFPDSGHYQWARVCVD